MNGILRAALGGLFAISFAAVAPSGPAAAAQETVSLSFAWPQDLRGSVDYTAYRARESNGRSDEVAISGRYDFVTSAVADGLLIRFENVETDVKSDGAGVEAMVKSFMTKAASTPPSYVVGRDGQFRRIEDVDVFRNAVLGGLDDAFADLPEQTRAQISQVMAGILTREQMEAGIVSDWNMFVGAWLEAELDQGDLYELQYEQPVPMLGNASIPMRTTFLFAGRTACDENDAGQGCVILEMKSFVDSDRLSAALEAFLSRFPADGDKPKVEALRQDMTVRLVTEPDTLLPHRLDSRRYTETRMTMNGETSVGSQVEEKRFVYRY